MGPVWRVSFEMFWEGQAGQAKGDYYWQATNIIHFTTWSAKDFEKEIPACKRHDIVGEEI